MGSSSILKPNVVDVRINVMKTSRVIVDGVMMMCRDMIVLNF